MVCGGEPSPPSPKFRVCQQELPFLYISVTREMEMRLDMGAPVLQQSPSKDESGLCFGLVALTPRFNVTIPL